MSNIEKEIKYLFNEKEFLILQNYLNNYNVIEKKYQRNYYFDSLDLDYTNSPLTLKIRYYDQKNIILTVKIKKMSIDNYFEKIEYEIPINNNDFIEIINLKNPSEKLKSYFKKHINLKDFNNIEKYIQNVILIGYLDTERINYQVPSLDSLITLDKNTYLEYKDFELEYEFVEDFEKQEVIKVENIFFLLGLNPIRCNNSKSSRFKKLKGGDIDVRKTNDRSRS